MITGHFHELLYGVLFVVTMPRNELEDVLGATPLFLRFLG